MNKIDYKEVLLRLGKFRGRVNLSRRETSLDLGYTEQFMKRIETGKIQLKVTTLLDFCNLIDIHPFEFFYIGKEYNKYDVYFFELFNSLSKENKDVIINLMKNLK